MLPDIIDKLTPTGKLPEGDQLSQGLEMLKKSFLKTRSQNNKEETMQKKTILGWTTVFSMVVAMALVLSGTMVFAQKLDRSEHGF